VKKKFTAEQLKTHAKQRNGPMVSHPEVQSLVFLVFERNASLPKVMPHPDHDCHWKKHGKWDSTIPLKFVFDERGSGLTQNQFQQALTDAYTVWSDVSNQVPKANFRPTTWEKPEEFTPSSHRSLRIPNWVNEISFEKRKTHVPYGGTLMPVVAEIYVWQKKDGSKIITETDVVISVDDDMSWCLHDDQVGDPNRWMLPTSYKFDIVGILVKAFGHSLGLHSSDTITHSMNGLYARDTCCKRSLECGDRKGVEAIYGKNVEPKEYGFQPITTLTPDRDAVNRIRSLSAE